MAANNRYAVIVPAYNEGRRIGGVVREFRGAGARNIIVADDGSVDGTGEEAGKAGAAVIAHEKNMGKGAAIKAGIGRAKTDWIILVDGDGQHSGNDLGKFLEKIESGKFDFVNGSRFLGKNRMPISRGIANWVVKMIFGVRSNVISDPLSGMRGFRKSKAKITEDGFLVDLELAFNAVRRGGKRSPGSGLKTRDSRLRVCEVPIEVRYFKGRKSKLTRFGHAFFEYARIVLYCAKRALLG